MAVPGDLLEILESRGVRVAELSADRNLWLQSNETPRGGGHPIIRGGGGKEDVVWIGGRCDGKAYVAPAPPWSYYRMPQLVAAVQKGGEGDGVGGLREDLHLDVQLLAAAGEATLGETKADLAQRFSARSGRKQTTGQYRSRLSRLRASCDAPALDERD